MSKFMLGCSVASIALLAVASSAYAQRGGGGGGGGGGFQGAPPPGAVIIQGAPGTAFVPPVPPSKPLASKALTASTSAPLKVTSPAWVEGGNIPLANTQYESNLFPGFTWTAGPAGKSYVIILEDADGNRNDAPIVQFSLYNIPPNVLSIPRDIAASRKPVGSTYGPNYRGTSQSYFGPRPPPGPKHHYHTQIFALDTTLTADPAMTYEQLIAGMQGHVLSMGTLIGLGVAPGDTGGGPGGPGGAPQGGGGRGGGGGGRGG